MSSPSSPYVSADEVEGISAVPSSGSCVVSVTSNGGCGNDGASVGSNSTKTRFSFYNAQEVQKEEQNQASVIGSTSPASSSSARGAQSSRKDEETARSTPTKTPHRSPIHQASSDHSNIKSGTNTAADQRFNFYVAGETSSSKEDDRRSPHTLLVTEEDKNDNKRTPAVASESTPNKPVLTINTSTPTPKQASTPQRANIISSSAQKKKQRAVQAAAARARSHNKSDNRLPTPQTVAMKPEEANDNTEASAADKMDSVEILRSLKDTEQMRLNLMKECHPSNDADSADTQEIYQDAAEEYISDSNTELQRKSYDSLDKEPGQFSYRATAEYQNSLQRPANTFAPTSNAMSATTAGNPYEDAIREALDLLRKHRPPSPGPQAPALQGTGIPTAQHQQQHLAIDMNVVHGAISNHNLRTPRDADRVLQSRWESPHNQEEINARRKERQERMARYTSRLAEIKGGENAVGNYGTDLHRPASTIDEGEEESRMSMDASTALDELVASASFASQQQQGRAATVSPSGPHRLVPSPGTVGIPTSCPSGDLASLDTASSLSASQYNPHGSQKDVHRSVERVLLAILERAHSNGRGVQGSSMNASASNASSRCVPEREEEKKSPSEERSAHTYSSPSPEGQMQPPQSGEDPLLRAVGELLSSSGGGSMASSGDSPLRPSDNTEQSSLTSGAKRSVVEELLAEAESFGDLSNLSFSRNGNRPGSGSQSWNERPKRAEDLLNCSTGVEAVRSDTDVSAVVVDKELDDLVMKTLGKSPSKIGSSNNPENSTDCEDDTGDYEAETSQSGSYDDDDDDDEDDAQESYDDDDSQVESDEDLDDALEGVLGPLSKTAGGTTGVVLESSFAPASPDRSNGERSIFDSLSNAMSSLVASAINGDEKPSALSTQASKASSSVRDRYATDMDSDGHVEEQSSSGSDDLDEEASELMRTLCAHLLPFGVDQSSRFLDEVPQWDESNPNEAGYRIIRLTSLQLQRVERAFEAMVQSLKKNSEQNLIASSQPEGVDNIDDTFERDLAAAEKALGEEENRTTAIMKALKLHPKASPHKEISDTGFSASQCDSVSVELSSPSVAQADVCHPDFPGVHSAGKGEMGDLEYFHLPVIFKSHVTGFEPTKDLFLEPGNIVAGQYLVESELGSAAFSTAYRCVDLNSEGDDTEDVSFNL